MSTKNLARTAIEGGRCGHNKRDRYDSHREERSGTRAYLTVVRNDPEAANEIAEPTRKVVYPCFHDKLSPVFRFLESRVGKSWGKTLSMLTEKFDTRTTPGRHVLHDHMLKEVADSKEALKGLPSWMRKTYFVDAQGLLQFSRPKPKVQPGKKGRKSAAFVAWKVEKWLGNRKVGQLGANLVWFHPTREADIIRAHWAGYQGMLYVVIGTDGKPMQDPIVPPPRFSFGPQTKLRPVVVPFRQGLRLDSEDEGFFRRLPKNVQASILKAAPVNSN